MTQVFSGLINFLLVEGNTAAPGFCLTSWPSRVRLNRTMGCSWAMEEHASRTGLQSSVVLSLLKGLTPSCATRVQNPNQLRCRFKLKPGSARFSVKKKERNIGWTEKRPQRNPANHPTCRKREFSYR